MISIAPEVSTLAAIASRRDEGTWFNRPVIQDQLLGAIMETIYMVGLGTLITVIIGLPLGVILAETRKEGLIPTGYSIRHSGQ